MWRGSATNAGKPFQEASRLKTNNGRGAETDSIDGFSFITSRCGMNRGKSFAGMRPAPTSKIEDRKQAEEQIRSENLALREEIDHASMFEEIVGSSEALHTVLRQVARVAPMDSTVLILGETGVGKELIARAIHKRSNRATRAFIRVNCAAIPPSLIASE